MKKKMLISLTTALFLYFVPGGLVFNHLLKPSKPDLPAFFEQHKRFKSEMEGFTQEIKKVDDGWVHCRVEMAAYAAGPPEHIHETFDEVFEVESGTVSILVNGEKKVLNVGETLVIPRGTPHKPFNETGERVVLNDTTNQRGTMPADFVYGLASLYPAMDKIGDVRSPKILLQLAAQGNGFDTWSTDAPIAVQKFVRWMLGPTARLLGYGKFPDSGSPDDGVSHATLGSINLNSNRSDCRAPVVAAGSCRWLGVALGGPQTPGEDIWQRIWTIICR